MKRRRIKQNWFRWWKYWMLHSNENPGSGWRKNECKYIQYTFLYQQVWPLCLSTESSIVSGTGMSLNAMMCIPEAHARWNPLCCHISPASAASEVKTSPLDRLFFKFEEKRGMLNQICVLETSLFALLTEVLSDFYAFSGLFCCHTTIGEHSSVISLPDIKSQNTNS